MATGSYTLRPIETVNQLSKRWEVPGSWCVFQLWRACYLFKMLYTDGKWSRTNRDRYKLGKMHVPLRHFLYCTIYSLMYMQYVCLLDTL